MVTVTSVSSVRVEDVTPAKPTVTVTVWGSAPSTTTSGDTDSSMPVSPSFIVKSSLVPTSMLLSAVPRTANNSGPSVTSSSLMVSPFNVAVVKSVAKCFPAGMVNVLGVEGE